VTDSSVRAAEKGRGVSFQRDASRVFEQVEYAIGVGIGIVLSVAAVLALTGAVIIAWDGVVQWPQIRGLFVIVDRLLFVLMIIEILHTVRASMQSHQLACEPFLIVGLIATIRRILVVTLETSDQPQAAQSGAGSAISFEHAMIELGVLAALTLVLAIAIYLSRGVKT
jgi:uncharacterized membrane protein (DUF373 family)